MKIDILCTDPNHPVHGWIEKWFEHNQLIHDIKRLNDKGQLRGGMFYFWFPVAKLLRPIFVRFTQM